MALPRSTALLAGLVAAAALSFSLLAAAGSAEAQTASAAGDCSGVSLTPGSRTIRRGGSVLLTGEACGATVSSSSGGSVQVKLRKGARWATVAKVQADSSGEFSVCARVAVPRKSKIARLRASTSTGVSGSTTLRVSNKGPKGCGKAPASEPPSGSSYRPPAPDGPGNPNCPLSTPNSEIGLTLPGECTVVASDTASSPDPTYFWDRIECQDATRHQRIASGGDEHPTGTGTAQGDDAFRRLTVYDGDEFSGERCELGHNNMNAPTAFYHEGQRRVTFASIRMPNSSPIGDERWRNVLQMKQAQPYSNPVQASVFEMQVRGSNWEVGSNWEGVWSAPATQNTWTRFAFDITYSQDAAIGSIKIYVDLNGDGDADDAGEESPRVHRPTLVAETAPAHYDGVGASQSIPSHLRAGIYQDATYECPNGCSVDIDNVQVVKP